MPKVMDARRITHALLPHGKDAFMGSGKTTCGVWVTWARTPEARDTDVQMGCVAVRFRPPRATVTCLWCAARGAQT